MDYLPCLDVVKREHEKGELLKEGNGEILDVHVVRFNVESRVQFEDALPGDQRLRHPLMLLLKQKLPI
jgi:hypothetical protein